MLPKANVVEKPNGDFTIEWEVPGLIPPFIAGPFPSSYDRNATRNAIQKGIDSGDPTNVNDVIARAKINKVVVTNVQTIPFTDENAKPPGKE